MTFWDLSSSDEFDYLDLILAPLLDRAADLSIPVMVVGAAARDLLLNGVAGAGPLRATADVDVAVAVPSWDDLDRLTEPFAVSGSVPHRFSITGSTVDIVPFGAVETDRRTIVWPNASEMSVIGFAEALASADTVKLRSGREVVVPCLAAQAVLKIIAWNDRRHVDSRDAEDLRSILRVASDGPYGELLYGENTELLGRFGWDPLTAGAALLGRQAHELLGSSGRQAVTTILNAHESGDGLLLSHMTGAVGENSELVRAFASSFAIRTT